MYKRQGIDWLVVSWKSSYQQVRSQRGSSNPWHTSAQVGSDLSLQFALSPNLNLECSYEWRHFTKEENSSHPDFHLLSGSMDWKDSKRLRLSLQCNNLLNSDDYVTRIDSPISQQISLLKLRPRSIFEMCIRDREWIKTKWAVLLLTLLGLGVTGYALLSLGRIVAVRGEAHLWEVLLSKDVLLLDALKYCLLYTSRCV